MQTINENSIDIEKLTETIMIFFKSSWMNEWMN